MNTGSNADVRQDIADVLIENAMGGGQFIGLEIFPVLPSEKKNGKLQRLAYSQIKTKVDVNRAPGSNYNRVKHATTSASFDCLEYGIEEPVDDGEAAVLGNYFDAEVAAAGIADYYVRLRQEKRIADIAFDSTTTFASYTAAVSKWSTAATATPVKNIQDAQDAILDNLNGQVFGPARWVLAMNKTTRTHLVNTTDIKNRAMYAMKGMDEVKDEALATVLGVDKVVYSKLKYNGSAVWATDKVGLYLVSDGTRIKDAPHVGRSVLRTEDSPENAMVETYRDETIRSNVVRVRQHVDELLLTARAGYVLTNIQ